jgi:hypothetical protein
MRNLLAFLAAAALTFAGLGWYLDWYKVQSTPSLNGRTNLNIAIDGKKISEDVHKGAERGAEKLHDVLDKAKATETNSPPSTQAAPVKPTSVLTPRVNIHTEEEAKPNSPQPPLQ